MTNLPLAFIVIFEELKMVEVYKSQEDMFEHYAELKAKLADVEDLCELLRLAESVGYIEGFEDGINAGMERETLY